ncbi:MAG: hypothetical protein ACLFRW_08385 [Halorhodospira sp.]
MQLTRQNDEKWHWWQKVLRRVRLTRSVLAITWSAGPVTGLGLAGGYIAAYGKLPNAELLTYFVTFTVVTGLIGLVAKIIHDGTLGRGEFQAQRDLDGAVDWLADLVLASRNLQAQAYEGSVQRQEIARQQLLRLDLPDKELTRITRQLTGNAQLAVVLPRIEQYHQSGLLDPAQKLLERYAEALQEALEPLRETAPQTASALAGRFYGHVFELREGVERDTGFLDRIHAAYQQDNLQLVTMSDVEQMFALAFELANGRQIPMLTITYRGRWRMGKALGELERAHNRYRLHRAAGDHRLRALAEYLAEHGLGYLDASVRGASTEELIRLIRREMEALVDQGSRMLAAHRRQRFSAPERARLAQLNETLSTAFALYQSARTAHLELGEHHADLLRATEHWQALTESAAGGSPDLRLDTGRRGLRIQESTIELEPEQRVALGQAVMSKLRELTLERRSPGVRASQGGGTRPWAISADQARTLALEITLLLDTFIGLSRAEVQRAVANSHASYLGDLRRGMSPREKRTLGELRAEQVHSDLSRQAEQIALVLTRHYRIRLSEEAVDFLQSTYAARPSVLATVQRTQDLPTPSYHNLASARPRPILRLPRDWYRVLARIRRALR